MKQYSFAKFLALYEIGYFWDDISFYFLSSPDEEHYIGYKPEYEDAYWCGLCDIKGGTEFRTAKELLTAPIYDRKSLEQRWDEVVIEGITSLDPKEWEKLALRSYGFERYKELKEIINSPD